VPSVTWHAAIADQELDLLTSALLIILKEK
jgi:hypothetical protein